MKLAEAFVARLGPVQGRIITGSPWADLLPSPPGFSCVRLPEIVKCGAGEYRPRAKGWALEEVLRERRARILRALEEFDPDLLVVDNVPCGLMGEVLPALHRLRGRRRSRLVLALRDILDECSVLRDEWNAQRAMETMQSLYDEIWVFGRPDILDPRAAYGMVPEVAAKTIFCGYLGPRASVGRSRDRSRPRAAAPSHSALRRTSRSVPAANGGAGALLRPEPSRRPSVLVTGGGGGDAAPLVTTFLDMLRTLDPPLRSRIVLGPDFPRSLRAHINRTRAPGAEVTSFLLDLPAAMASADVTVSMVGYNTFSEILSLGSRAVVVPRIRPRREQWLRAVAHQGRPGTIVLHPDQLGPGSLWEAIEEASRSPRPDPMEASGARKAAERAAALLGVKDAAA